MLLYLSSKIDDIRLFDSNMFYLVVTGSACVSRSEKECNSKMWISK